MGLLGLQPHQPVPVVVEAGRGAVDRGPERTQLAAGLGRRGGHRPCHPVAVVVLGVLAVVGGGRVERGPLGVEPAQLLAQHQPDTHQVGGLGIGGGQPGPQPLGLGFKAGHDGAVDEPLALAIDAPAAFGHECGEAPGPFPERLEPADHLTKILGTQAGELGLGGEHVGVEDGEGALVPGLGRRELGHQAGLLLEPGPQAGQLAPGEEHPQRHQLGHEIAVAASRVCLAFERAELATHLPQQVLEPDEVGFGGGQPPFGLFLTPPVLEHAGRFLDDEPPVLGPGVEDGVDLALRHDDMLLATDAGVGQQLLHVEQPAVDPVDRVLAVTAAEQGPGDGDLGEDDREEPGRVVDGERDLGPAQRRPMGAAGEDHVVHLLAAHCAGRLRAEHPADCVDQVRLPRAVRSHDNGGAGLELEGGGVGEGLEALEGQRLEEHLNGDVSESSGAAGAPRPVVRPGSAGRRRSNAAGT